MEICRKCQRVRIRPGAMRMLRHRGDHRTEETWAKVYGSCVPVVVNKQEKAVFVIETLCPECESSERDADRNRRNKFRAHYNWPLEA